MELSLVWSWVFPLEPNPKMKRSKFLKITAAGGVFIIFGLWKGIFLKNSNRSRDVSIAAALKIIDSFKTKELTSSGAWKPAYIFSHCAQSLEYAISGFPEHKPELYKQTIGKLALSFFSSRKKLSHALDDPIPGAPAIPEDVPVLTALNRLEKAFVALRDHQDSFQPHFVFGSLTKEQYALVQVIHFYNHLDEVRAV